MRRLLTILSAVALAFGALAIEPPPEVDASGTCTSGSVILYGTSNWTGRSIKICYGVNDSFMSGEPGVVIGPDANGATNLDFDTTNGTSGISSYTFHDPVGGPNVGICFYINPNYSGLGQFDRNTGSYKVVTVYDNAYESMAWMVGDQCP